MNEWIKIADRLPPDRELVLVRCKIGELFVGFMSSHNQEWEPRIYCHQIESHWKIDEVEEWQGIP